jgi:hypothetical protein
MYAGASRTIVHPAFLMLVIKTAPISLMAGKTNDKVYDD